MSDDDNFSYRYTNLGDLALNKSTIVNPLGGCLYNPYNPLLLGLIPEWLQEHNHD